MKQFQYTTRFGYTSDVLTTDEANTQFPESVPAFAFLEVGETAKDVDGDLWRRLPDKVDVEQIRVEQLSDTPGRDERLERIATAALQGLIASGLPLNEEPAARRAIVFAKALIAELDKQA